MALLSLRRSAVLSASAVGLALAGCAVLDALRGPRPLAFSHALHVQQEELDCVICHDGATFSDEPGMPDPDTCSLCHDELDAERPPERAVSTLFDDGGAFRAAHHAALADELRFSHALHAGGDLECAECHRGIETSERLTPAIGVDMGRCTACHEAQGQPTDCATCHTEVDRDWRPPSHERAWLRAHGAQSRAARGVPSQECSTCHSEGSCAACHLDQPPASHTNTFRLKTHGLHAALDRRNCAACHRSDACDACHMSTRPQSHFGNWGSRRNRHCLGCHFPARDNGCFTCHKGTPSHLLAAPKPDWHTPAMICRQCHGISAPLPHVDKGDDCNACHL